MQKSHIAVPEVSTFAELSAHYRALVKDSFSNDILIRNGPLALISDRDYHYTDDRTSISEIKEEQAVIHQHMIRVKTHPEEAPRSQLTSLGSRRLLTARLLYQ